MTSLMDFSSSPDPLGDEVPSSIRTITRRTAGNLKPYQRDSSLQIPSSIRQARPLSAGKSPRKQTFELDVGNERSPQRLLVTVEADDERGRRSGVNRRLFTLSPTRSPSRKRQATTTTSVPLRGLTDDEGGDLGDEPTPRRRGRPRTSLGSKNGTPNPRGKKRAGTPLRRTSRAKRHSGEAPSEATLPSDALLEANMNTDAEPTPKPKTRTRKTPKKASTPAVPSSKATGRKRGRPRKALMPDEVAGLTNEAEHRNDDAGVIPTEHAPTIEVSPKDPSFQDEEKTQVEAFNSQNSRFIPDSDLPSQGKRHRSLAAAHSSDPIREMSAHEARAGDDDAPMFDDFAGEPHSDLDSEIDGADGLTYSGQDNLTHASEFSMIDVEALPSFQASFQSNRSAMIGESHRFAEAGDETNLIINQTLEELRRSTQSEFQDQTNTENTQNEIEEGLPAARRNSLQEARNSPSNFGSSQLSWTRSPRRQQKAMPLSRQIFTNRAPHVDDSFSSIPDSILQAATPGRLPMKPPSTRIVDEDSNMYEDSFSEIPDEILTAATPRPTRTAVHPSQGEDSVMPSSEGEVQSATRYTNIGTDRLPTPDDTNSSTTDAKNGHGEDTQMMAGDLSANANTSDLNIRSSPPTISRQFNTMNIQSESAHTISRHFDTMAIQSEALEAEQIMEGASPHKSPSPPRGSADSGSPKHSQSLQPPAQSRRPTLSPIVRAGRTLQNIMSDKSSPDDRGSSLGSPFRGSARSDSRHSSVAKSPVRSNSHRRADSDSRLLFSSIASFSQSARSVFGLGQRAASVSAPVVGDIEDPFGPDMPDYSQTEELRRSAYGTGYSQSNSHPSRPEFFPEVPSSTRAAPPSEQGIENHEMSEMAEQDPSSPATQRSKRMSASKRAAILSLFSTRSSSSNRQLQGTGAEKEEKPEEKQDALDDVERDEQLEEEQEVIDGIEHDEQVEEEQDVVNGIEQDDDQFLETQQELEAEQSENDSARALEVADDGDIDLWDVEASRSTPRSPNALRAEAQVPKQSYNQVETAALASTSVLQEAAPVATNVEPPRRSKIPSPWRRNVRRLIYQDNFRSPSEIDMEDSPPSDVDRATSVLEVAVQQEKIVEPSPEPVQQEVDMSEGHVEGNFEDDGWYGLAEREVSDEPQQPSQASEQHTSDPPVVEHSMLHEYSMASPYDKSTEVAQEAQVIQEKPAPARRSFFGSFDILSFFSSPRPPPITNNPPKMQVDETPIHKTAIKPLPRSIQGIERPLSEEPRSALRATGLFPAIRQKVFNPSPERRVDLFSPGTALRSSDTVADTYAESPLTPERQQFVPIPQKRNFTPLSGQSRNTASLFTPSRQGSTPSQEARTPSPEYDDLREPEYSDEEESMVTDGPSFERIPPREKPSQWDKTLSPTKSCLRSPLKPKTPGRVVEFKGSVLSPETQENVRADQQLVLNTLNNGGAKIATINPRTAILNPTPLRIPASFQSHDQDKENTPSPTRSPERRLKQSAQPRPQALAPPKLSPTTWSRAHWIRLDEILQFRKRDPMQFQMLYPSVFRGKHPLSGLEVATQDAKMVLEDWHLEVVEAFRSELAAQATPLGERGESNKGWDARTLSKRLFALMVGEERRRSGKYVSGQSRKTAAKKGQGKEVAVAPALE